ncbi:tail fiber domain-containing protein [Erwinia persicina]|uniref:Tail fiber domain-containing protein n=1 Tax=Erwinia persicina TaxID=55211 RepID=A0ABR8ZT10_9GAMM|nr:tail fiber domain-containing protein [Erwinia persicina]MBD8106645.1 tail fiber domain-containing protein [Erwinia persicina]MBD8209724.1 tail fiber domain-containing protein [Erwinia persicina]
MPAGTIALTNNSTTVGGTGTAFTTELKVGDFIAVTVGGAPYTMIVASIASNTQLTIAQAYNGPTASGLAWYGIPATLKYAITQQVLNDMATNQRGMIAQLANWQKIYSDAASVTVERPDRSTFTGPSWGYIAAQYGRLGNSATRNVGNTANTVAAGDDSRLSTLDGKSGGTVTGSARFLANSLQLTPTSDTNGWASSLAFTANDVAKSNMVVIYTDNYGDFTIQVGGVGDKKSFKFGAGGNATALNGTWVSSSDKRIKNIDGVIVDPLDKMMKIRGRHWHRKDGGLPGYGFIAQDVQAVFPDAVMDIGDQIVEGELVKNVLAPDTAGVSAALHHESILALMKILRTSLAAIAESTSDKSLRETLSNLANIIPKDGANPEPAPENEE